jgi:hypothetical protein
MRSPLSWNARQLGSVVTCRGFETTPLDCLETSLTTNHAAYHRRRAQMTKCTLTATLEGFQFSETNVMHLLFKLLRVMGLYMLRALLAHSQEALHKRHLVYCRKSRSRTRSSQFGLLGPVLRPTTTAV